jgi:hypothetical protein
MTPPAPLIPRSDAWPTAASPPVRTGRRPRLRWRCGLPAIARHVAWTMPWLTLIAGCLAGTVYLAIIADVADTAHSPLAQGAVRFAFLPAVAALAFVLRTPFRPLIQTTPVPAWVAPVSHLVLATPVLATTCWVQLRIMDHTIPLHAIGHPPGIYPLIAQLTGWCAIIVAAAACVDRSRYADLSGAIAGPAGFAAIALAWYAPVTARFLAEPPATAQEATIAWYAIAAAALALTCAAMRDRWHRYALSLHRHGYRSAGPQPPGRHLRDRRIAHQGRQQPARQAAHRFPRAGRGRAIAG